MLFVHQAYQTDLGGLLGFDRVPYVYALNGLSKDVAKVRSRQNSIYLVIHS